METDQVLLLAGLLVLSAFFSAAETALFSISPVKAAHLAKQGGRAHLLIKRMKDDPHRLLTTILIGNNLVNIAASSIATALALELVGSYAVGAATGVMTFAILIFGEMFPKSIATRNNVMIARLVIAPLHAASVLLYPLVVLLNFIPKMTERFQRRAKLTEEELLTMVEAVEREGQIKEEERELIHNVFEFDDISASEIMTPRADMFVVDVERDLDIAEIFKSGFTRIPVIEGTIDRIVGILNIKDLVRHISADSGPPDIRRLMREPYFVPEHKKLDNLLKGFKRRKQHMAIVVDEHGGVSGLVTLEDALEELVGEIVDETDIIEPEIERLRPGEWRVMGKAEIEAVNAALGMNIPDTGEYETFSGYILNRIGRIPREEEEIAVGDFRVVVKEREGNRIVEYRVRHTPPPPFAPSQS
jgi:CBS domain containing-hemolysin-like protein